MQNSYDAVVVGSGPNGLSAAIRLAERGLSVLVYEGSATIGGGLRSAQLTLPGFVHDVCAAVHPFGIASPFFKTLPLDKFGLHWVEPEFPLAHPLENGKVAVLERSLHATAARFGPDESSYKRLFEPITRQWEQLVPDLLRPMLRLPSHPLPLMGFGWRAMRSASGLVNSRFKTESARALFAGMAAHSFLSLDRVPSAAFGLLLSAAGHTCGWPFARGGSQATADALQGYFISIGGKLMRGAQIKSFSEIPPARAVLLDVSPRQLLVLAGDRLPPSYRHRLEAFRYGPGVFKVDYALSAPIPWRSPECHKCGTVHVGGTFEEIAAAEQSVAAGNLPERPFVLLAQPTLFDPSRAPEGKHTAWAYCHVPHGSTFDMTEWIESQIERFAPGFRDCILARHTMNCADMERRNPNLVGGDISGGANDFWQLLRRPVLTPYPYRLPLPGYYLCSASTPPGGGAHGMCGFHAAETAIRDCF